MNPQLGRGFSTVDQTDEYFFKASVNIAGGQAFQLFFKQIISRRTTWLTVDGVDTPVTTEVVSIALAQDPGGAASEILTQLSLVGNVGVEEIVSVSAWNALTTKELNVTIVDTDPNTPGINADADDALIISNPIQSGVTRSNLAAQASVNRSQISETIDLGNGVTRRTSDGTVTFSKRDGSTITETTYLQNSSRNAIMRETDTSSGEETVIIVIGSRDGSGAIVVSGGRDAAGNPFVDGVSQDSAIGKLFLAVVEADVSTSTDGDKVKQLLESLSSDAIQIEIQD